MPYAMQLSRETRVLLPLGRKFQEPLPSPLKNIPAAYESRSPSESLAGGWRSLFSGLLPVRPLHNALQDSVKILQVDARTGVRSFLRARPLEFLAKRDSCAVSSAHHL